MIQRTPHYYKNFQCIGSACKNNCCMGGWEIDIDDETVEYYKTVKGEFGRLLNSSIDFTDEYCFKQKDGKCPLLDSNNLCRVYQELGPEKMGIVCAQFPRFSEYFGDVKETGIGLACEEACRIIFSDREAFSFDEVPLLEEQNEDSEFDLPLYNSLFIVRNKLISLIESDKYNVHQKLMILLNLCDKLQTLINKNDYDLIKKISDEFQPDSYIYTDCNLTISLNEALTRIWYAYFEIEILSEDYKKLSNDCFDALHPEENGGNDEYLSTITAFSGYINQREDEYLTLIKYYIFRYLLKAVYDHDIIGKARLIICNYLIIRDLGMYSYIKNESSFSTNDHLEILRLFSREVEYSYDNILTLAEEFLFDDVFKTDTLRGIIETYDKYCNLR